MHVNCLLLKQTRVEENTDSVYKKYEEKPLPILNKVPF